MRLYHFTARFYLPSILGSGRLLLTESNLSPYVTDAGPRVVWLTDSANPTDHGLSPAKREVRIDVDTTAAVRWADFAALHGINRQWYRVLDRTGGFTARHWWVSAVEIPVTPDMVKNPVDGSPLL